MITHPRPDMSDWVLHFIHDRNPNYNLSPDDIFGEGAPKFFPAHANSKKDDRFVDFYESENEDDTLPADASAFQILNKIIDQGLLKSGWSFRNRRTTIYGPKSAVCFTEMPLSSLVAYAQGRSDDGSVCNYAVGLLKSELFTAGGRPVIYGVSGEHKEKTQEPWPRFLSKECGIGEAEQYRYVALRLGTNRKIDWTHEREWRWADHSNLLDVPGLPIWRANEHVKFSRALVIVQTEKEATELLSHLRRCLDAESDMYSNDYDILLLKSTFVVSLEQLKNADLLGPDTTLTIEQIPYHLLQPVPTTPASSEAKTKARQVIDEAIKAAGEATSEWREKGDRGPCGFSELIIDDGLAEFTRAGIELGLMKSFAGTDPSGSGGYWVLGVSETCGMQGIGEAEVAAKAAEKVIERHFPGLQMHIWSRLD